jgi:hypothetical protein
MNDIQNSYLINSLTITGQGEVTIDCGTQYFMRLGSINTGRIVNVKVENLTVRGGVSVTLHPQNLAWWLLFSY